MRFRKARRTFRSFLALVTVCIGGGLIAAASPLTAQVDIEALRSEAPPLGRSGSLGGDLSIRTGNVSFVAVDLRARLYDVTESQSRLLIGDGGIGFLDRSRFSSSGLLHYRISYRSMHPRVTPEWYLQANYDRSQLLNFRALGGVGARTRFASGEWGEFGAGSGFMLEFEALSLPDTAVHPSRTLEVRSSNFLTLRVVPTETLVITSTTYIQPALRNLGDYRALETLRLSASVTETLALTVSFDLRYDGSPPDGIARLDTRLRTGVTYAY